MFFNFVDELRAAGIPASFKEHLTLLEALDNLQSKRSMALREQVNVMSGKMTVVLVTCFFPPLLIFIAGPAFMSISETLGGL